MPKRFLVPIKIIEETEAIVIAENPQEARNKVLLRQWESLNDGTAITYLRQGKIVEILEK